MVIELSSFWMNSGSEGARVSAPASEIEGGFEEESDAELASPGLYVEVMAAVEDVQGDNEICK